MANRLTIPRVLAAGLLAAGLLAAPAARAADEPKADEPKPYKSLVASTFKSPQTQAINELIAQQWAANGIKPSRVTTDFEFCRRLHLDLLGRIPSAEEVRAFANDTQPNKRGRLINKLLNDPNYSQEFAEHWGEMWSIWTLTRTGPAAYRKQTEVWFADRLARNQPYDQMVAELLTATGENTENGAVNFILSHVGETRQDRDAEGAFEAVPITSRVTKLFLGIQTQCAQCHDHPFNPDWTQDTFWGVNAFFRQVERGGAPAMPQNGQMMVAAKLKLSDNTSYNKDAMVYFEKRDGTVHYTKARFLKDINSDKESPAKVLYDPKKTRRQHLAEFVTKHDNFGRAYVNRVWGHLFGRGLNDQAKIDDFGEHNKVIHPELMARLAGDFNEYAKYNSKELFAWICNSDAYNLSSVANGIDPKQGGNADVEGEKLFARMPLKAMSPEQIFESLQVATDPPSKKNGRRRDASPELKTKRDTWLGKLVRNFGDDEGNETTSNGTVVQALLMMNGKELNDELNRADNNPIKLAMAKSKAPGLTVEAVVLDDLFIRALGRPATQAEESKIAQVFAGKYVTSMIKDKPEAKKPAGTGTKPDPKKKPEPNAPAGPAVPEFKGDPKAYMEAFYEDVFWALLNTNEFILNH